MSSFKALGLRVVAKYKELGWIALKNALPEDINDDDNSDDSDSFSFDNKASKEIL